MTGNAESGANVRIADDPDGILFSDPICESA
jgi:hypothetical protein